MPSKEVLPDNVPFGIGRDLIVDIPIDPRRIINIYIDNFLGITIDLEDTDNARSHVAEWLSDALSI